MDEILLVEDDVDLRELFAEVLRSAGYVVYEAVNGKDALEQLESRSKPCLLLLDLMMPIMSGPQLLRALEERQRLPPAVIALSACDLVHEVPQVNGYLPKPVLPQQLLEAVSGYCEPTEPRSWMS